MQRPNKIDYAKLLGFQALSDQPSAIDFQDETFAARLGAKVGVEAWANSDVVCDKIDYAKLLGFQALSDQPSASVDFQDENFAARLGAKVGHEPGAPLPDAARQG
jgi:hypothetical protein